jgi:hypothetical protein
MRSTPISTGNPSVDQFLNELQDFDLDLVGFHCAGELEPDELVWRCPFNPGCGATKHDDCPLMKRLAQISRMPKEAQ